MKYMIYALQYIFILVLTVSLVLLFPIYLHANENIPNEKLSNKSLSSKNLSSENVANVNIVTVEIKKFKFIPAHINIKPGTTVRWVNKEKRQYHSVWFKQLNEVEPEYFFPDESYQRKFETAGKFSYRCGPHPEMKGSINVKF